MLSRVAENLYWIARYVERAAGLARLLEHAYSLELEAGAVGETRPLDNALDMLDARAAFDGYRGARADGPAPADDPPSPFDEREEVLHFLTFHRPDCCSLRSMVARARENARG